MEMSDDRVHVPLALICTFAALSVIYFSVRTLYDVFIGPLSHVPGPNLNAISRLPHVRDLLQGTTVETITKLHKKYGDVVRFSPNEVSFTSMESAFPDIYGFRTGKLKGHVNMQKDPVWYAKPANGVPSILIADDEYHSRGRRILSHAFSEKALADQEPLIQSYADQLVDRLREVTTKTGEAQDMTKWYNWTTFDVIADLTFGEPFGCLQDLETHKYITLLLQAVKGFRIGYILHYYPWLQSFGQKLVPVDLLERRKEFIVWVKSQVRKRIERDTQRPDFMTHILANNGTKGAALTNEQIDSNANTLLVAGSETTATLLSGVTYCLLANPNKHEKLKRELRDRFKEYSEITLAAVNECPYLIAVLSEALRYFPPVPAGFQRLVGPGGEVVSGCYLPEGTSVSVSHYPAYHSEANFKDADDYVPERWLPDQPKYADDKRSACQPFSFGPRNCLGKNLAYAEMRLILAKIVWSFDMELQPECREWMQNLKVMTLWDKSPLMVKMNDVKR